jgi:ankyrin repeat protein
MTSSYYNDLEEVKLIAAIVNDEYEEVGNLLQDGVNVNEKNALGATPLYWAAYVGNLDCISTLLDLGADVRATTLKGETALHFAAKCGHAQVLLLLLDWGADIQAADLRERTVLHAAIEEGEDNYEVVSLLIERGVDVLATDVDGRTALECTHGLKQQNIATLLKLKRSQLSPSPKYRPANL